MYCRENLILWKTAMIGKKYFSQLAEGEHSEINFYLWCFKDFYFICFYNYNRNQNLFNIFILLFSEAEKKLAVDQALRDSMKDVVVSHCQIHVWLKKSILENETSTIYTRL